MGKGIPENLEGKTVIVGLSAKGLGAQIPTPGGLLYPHELQANALQTIYSDKSISRPLWGDSLELLVISLVGLLIILSVYYAPIWLSSVFFFFAVAGSASGVWYVWNEFQILLDLSASLIIYILLFTSARVSIISINNSF